jgi:hypothetical protein
MPLPVPVVTVVHIPLSSTNKILFISLLTYEGNSMRTVVPTPGWDVTRITRVPFDDTLRDR